MRKNSTTRRSSTIPIRLTAHQREDQSLSRGDVKKLQSKSKSPTRHSHIPRARFRSSSSDGCEYRRSNFKATGKTPLKNAPTSPVTPANIIRLNVKQRAGSAGVLNGHTGRRSPSSDRGSILGGKSARKDTRCLTDKTYQVDMITKIENYIQNQCISHVSLKPMSLSVFVEISNLLLQTLNVKPALTLNNYIENLPKIAKRLNYPGTVAKSWLKTANAPHSWPQVLGWLSWMVEACERQEYVLQTFQLENVAFRESTGSNGNTFSIWLNMYSAWNSVNLEEEESLMEEFLVKIESASGIDEENLEQACKELVRMEQQLQIVKDKSTQSDTEIARLKDIFVDLQNNVDQINEQIAQKNKTLDTKRKENDKSNIELNNLKEQKHSLTKHRNDVRLIIKNQPMSKMEKDSILKKCLDLENHSQAMQKMLMDSKKKLYGLRIKSSSIAVNLKELVIAHNDFIIRLDSDAMGIAIDKESLLFPEKNFLADDSTDVLNFKEKLLNELIENFGKRCHQHECLVESNNREIDTTLKKIQDGEHKCKQLEKQLEALKNHMNQIERDRKIEEDRLNNDIETFQSNIEKFEAELKILKTDPLQEELEEAKEKLEAIVRRKTFLEESATRFFDEFYSILADHRKELLSTLEDPPS